MLPKKEEVDKLLYFITKAIFFQGVLPENIIARFDAQLVFLGADYLYFSYLTCLVMISRFHRSQRTL